MKIKALIYRLFAAAGVYISLHPPKENSFHSDLSKNVLQASSGVLHIGASKGQEASTYHAMRLPVVWVEAIPEVYQELRDIISTYPHQKAICALLGDVEGKQVTFNIASNSGESSSIFELAENHGFLNGELIMTDKISLPMRRLDSMFSAKALEIYSHWVIDVQGAEMLVLRGAGDLLKLPQTIEVEVSTRTVYEGGATHDEIKDLLAINGFVPAWTFPENSHGDLLFIRAR